MNKAPYFFRPSLRDMAVFFLCGVFACVLGIYYPEYRDGISLTSGLIGGFYASISETARLKTVGDLSIFVGLMGGGYVFAKYVFLHLYCLMGVGACFL